ncbi:DUF1640 domain-containing protein [Pseudomonas gingeri]|uniref:DUF1640 domain-containing protein n=1 Tax=Pseudomonas gingeri TaxID=117681 RepID=UPI0015A38330|nr:DUF1640 domain-containing protein [Pseudomonas gingeri]NVZ99546.1 DUF1640 domain-containing protein [Pseudomonas gingeri]NWA15432.1 DUF1640 domain-containing protein [Pseudomonas gingeri]NWA56659.1 DUF1640 domain-containing protein [Pseudomonas gingeri]NWA95153.1 DUF1640 domain-containing protein [Pseudomonas gingeri]NWB05235.1 DUF1640 domain-containing protein [Pseudomonas gingeri]
MRLSLSLYDALVATSAPTDKAKAVVDAWEADMQDFASKSDLQQTEERLQTSIKEQGNKLRSLINEQGNELRNSIGEQGSELRLSMQEQGAELRLSMSGMQSQINVMRWQIGLVIVCVAIPLFKLAFELLTP